MLAAARFTIAKTISFHVSLAASGHRRFVTTLPDLLEMGAFGRLARLMVFASRRSLSC